MRRNGDEHAKKLPRKLILMSVDVQFSIPFKRIGIPKVIIQTIVIPFLKIYIALAVLMKYETPVIPATGVRLMTLSLKVVT